MQQTPRNGASIDRIYVHTNEGPEAQNGAVNLAAYLHTIDAGYHVIVDNEHTVRVAADDQVVWASGGDNTHSLSVCLIGTAAQTAAQWADPYSKAELERAAQQVAAWCQLYDVPVHDVAPGAPGYAPTEHGIAAHDDDNAPAAGGHTDPGPNFPWAAFIARVQAIIDAKAIDWKGLVVLAQWHKEMHAEPVREKDSGWKVTTLKQLLAKRAAKYDVGNDHPYFGSRLVKVVHDFKHDVLHDGRAADGHVAGGRVADALLNIKH